MRRYIKKRYVQIIYINCYLIWFFNFQYAEDGKKILKDIDDPKMKNFPDVFDPSPYLRYINKKDKDELNESGNYEDNQRLPVIQNIKFNK